MVILQNIVVTQPEGILLMNLVSMRRKFISFDELKVLKSIDEKLKNKDMNLSVEETSIYDEFKKEKQILSDADIANFNKEFTEFRKEKAKNINYNIAKILDIELTENCNFNCKYCFQKKYANGRTLNIQDITNIRTVLDKYLKENNFEYDVKTIVVTGGETLLESNIPLIWEISKVFSETKMNLLTNGVNITKYFYDLPYNRIEAFQVSLDGNNDVISKLSLNGNKTDVYSTIIDGIKLALEHNIDISINSMINSDNADNIEKFIESLKQNDILDKVSIEFTPVTNYESDVDIDMNFYDNNVNSFIDAYRKIAKIMPNYNNISIKNFKSLAVLEGNIIRENNKKPNYIMSRCSWTDGVVLTFSTDRNIYWCVKSNEGLGVIGDFSETMAIDKEKIRDIFERCANTMEECQNCIYRFVCCGGCYLFSLKNKGENNKPYCGCFKNEYLLDNIDKLIY